MDRVTPKTSPSRRLNPRRRLGARSVTTPKILLAFSTHQPDPTRRSGLRVRRSRNSQHASHTQNSSPTESSAETPVITVEEIQHYLDPRRDEKYKLEKVLKKESVVCAKKCQKLPKVYQQTQKIRYRENQRYPFTTLKGQEHFPTLTTKLEPESRSPAQRQPTPVSRETTPSIKQPSPPRTPFGVWLLRRPTTLVPRPLEEEDDAFQEFANRLDLTPLLIDDSPFETLKFYTYNYPLLLRTLREEDRDKFVDRRSIIPILGVDGKKRGADVGMRLKVLDKDLGVLDKETTDGRFYTELRDDTFDPRKWPWNRTRYQ